MFGFCGFFTLRRGKLSSSKTFAILCSFTILFFGWVRVTIAQLLHMVGGNGGWFLFFGVRVFFHIVTIFSSFCCNFCVFWVVIMRVGGISSCRWGSYVFGLRP